ncbi:MAG: DEAD/DEAH box helicase [Patescibacteria group bacterium]
MFRKSFPRRIKSYKPNNNNGIRSPFGRGPVASKISHEKYISSAVVNENIVSCEIKHKFSDFEIDERIKATVIGHGYDTPTPIQDQAIPEILLGRDVVGIANTGTGKTAAFLIPNLNKILLDRTIRALIVAPTRELAMQIEDEFRIFSRGLGIYSTLCIGGAGLDRQIANLRRSPNIVIGTVGRLKDLANNRNLNYADYKIVVLDEVDRMVDIGFIQDIRKIMLALPRERQSLFFSATLTPEVSGIIRDFSKNPINISVKTQETTKNVEQDIIKVSSKEEKLAKLFEMLKKPDFNKVMIFGRTKWNVEKLSNSLMSAGFSAISIHGNKSQGQRMRALSLFKEGKVQTLVATDVAARGLDISNVSHVINFDEPQSYTDYVHRIGRTGRAGKTGQALTFVI